MFLFLVLYERIKYLKCPLYLYPRTIIISMIISVYIYVWAFIVNCEFEGCERGKGGIGKKVLAPAAAQ